MDIGLRATVFFKENVGVSNEIKLFGDLFNRPKDSIKCNSATELFQRLEEVHGGTIGRLLIQLYCFEEIETKEGVSLLVLEWWKVLNDPRIQALSNLTSISLIHFTNFDRQAAISIRKEIYESIGGDIDFQELTIQCSDDSMTTEEKTEVLIDDITSLFDPALTRWRNMTNDQLKTLDIEIKAGNSNSFIINGNKVLAEVSNPSHFLSRFARINSSGENRFLLIEKMKIVVEGGMKQPLKTFMEVVAAQSHSLLNFSAQISGRDIEAPIELKEQIEANLTKKMAVWIKNGTRVEYGRMKLMLIGKGQAGKSSTVRSLLKEPFDKDIQSTVVAEADKDVSINVQDVSAAWKRTNVSENWVSKELGEYMGKIKSKVTSGNKGVIVRDRFNKSQQSQNETIVEDAPIIRNLSRQGDGNETIASSQKKERKKKVLLLDRIKDTLQFRTKKKNKNQWLSSEESARLTIWDFGGQEVFYSLHHLYLTTGGLYLLVFNLELLKSQMTAEFRQIEFWLESVALHAPGASVIMIGTRCYKLSKQALKDIDVELKSLVATKPIELLSSENLSFFPIDNAKSKLIEKQIAPLRAKITHCFERENKDDDLEQNIWQKKICLSWIYFMNYLIKMFKGVISTNKLIQVANGLGLETERDVLPMLEFYKNAGGIIPFVNEENNVSSVFDYVVLSPEWLLKVIGSFIYDNSMHNKNKRFYEHGDTRSLITNYENTGVLSRNLLKQILEEAKVSGTDANFIINMCKKTLLMSDLDFFGEYSADEDTFYLVPTMNRQIADELEIEKEAAADACINLYIHCHQYIPIGVFERIICIVLSLNRNYGGASIDPVIKKNFARFSFREVEIFIVNQQESRDFRVSIPEDEVEDSNVLVNVVTLIDEALERLSFDVLGREVKAELQLESSKGQKLRCSWKDLIVSVENSESTKVRAMFSDGTQKLKRYFLFKPFPEVIELIAERKRNALLQEQAKEDALTWDHDCFLAHSWGPNNETHAKVVEISKLLNSRDLTTWLDETNLKCFVADDIVRGVRKSACILIFITEHYLLRVEDKNSNASREFAQAVAKGIRYLIPVVLDPKCLNPKFWAGSMVSYHLEDALYHDFSSPEKIKANIGKLCDRIEEMSRGKRPRNSFDTEI